MPKYATNLLSFHTALISPSDLFGAAQLFASLAIPIQLKQYPSGLYVLQTHRHSFDMISTRIISILDSCEYTTALEVAEILGQNLAMSTEYLQEMEQMGTLVRDEQFTGVTFWREDQWPR